MRDTVTYILYKRSGYQKTTSMHKNRTKTVRLKECDNFKQISKMNKS